MKIRIEIEENLKEDEIIIRTKKEDDRIQKIKEAVNSVLEAEQKMIFYKGDSSFYLKLDDILFYETQGAEVYAHTAEDAYLTKNRLYELIELLPKYYMRASKSCIVNVKKIYSLTRSLSMGCVAGLSGTHKQVYVSRQYYKMVRENCEKYFYSAIKQK